MSPPRSSSGCGPVAVSGFGSRQVLYERFFFGPQHVMASIYYDLYDKDEMMDRVTDLLNPR
jgi:4-hydroxyphenylacetate 3-monooxygenase